MKSQTKFIRKNPSRKEVIAESAEPRSNDELKARGVRLTAAKKRSRQCGTWYLLAARFE